MYKRQVTGTASKGAALFRKKAAAEAKKRIKKVEAGKKPVSYTHLDVYKRQVSSQTGDISTYLQSSAHA